MKSILESRGSMLLLGLGVLGLLLTGCGHFGTLHPEPEPPFKSESISALQAFDRLRLASVQPPKLRVAGGIPAFVLRGRETFTEMLFRTPIVHESTKEKNCHRFYLSRLSDTLGSVTYCFALPKFRLHQRLRLAFHHC